jgi:hypothetical protein
MARETLQLITQHSNIFVCQRSPQKRRHTNLPTSRYEKGENPKLPEARVSRKRKPIQILSHTEVRTAPPL